jgi:hypothetical protein
VNDDYFEIRFLSNEQDFIYNFGVNRGHTLSFSKVNRCYFLSAEAKQLYHNICDYAWGAKRECRPSQTTLRTELGWGRHSMDKYLNELRDADLVLTQEQGYMKPLIYQINELHQCNKIIHSEVVHQVREELSVAGDVFLKALEAYRDTIMSSSNRLIPSKEMVKEWFQMRVYDESPKVEEAATKKTTGIAKYSEGVQTVGDPTKKGKVAYDPDDATTWNSHHFTSFFCDLYKEKYGTSYQSSASKDSGQIARLIRERTEMKDALREKMVDYVMLDHFTPKTIAGFCSSYSQSVLDEYAKTGKIPEYQPAKKSNMALDLITSDDDFKVENRWGRS